MTNRAFFAGLLLLFTLVLTLSGQTQSRARRVQTNLPSANAPSTETQTPSKPTDPKQETVGDDDVIRVNTALITVPVSVLDRDGRYLIDLEKEDFQVYEDGVAQEIAYFGTIEKPVTVVLMIDTSASTWSKLGQIKEAANAFVDQLRPDDLVMVVSFARGLTVEGEATSDREKIRRAINGTGKGSSTHLYDAMDKVMHKQLTGIQGRKALVLFTDGVDASSNNSTYEGTVRFAQELDAVIYPIRYDTYNAAADKGGSSPGSQPTIRLPWILRKLPISIGVGSTGGNTTTNSGGGTGSTRAEYDRGEEYLRDLAGSTGGRLYQAGSDLGQLRFAFNQIAEELTRQYTLGYYPKKVDGSGEVRKIRVRVNRSNVAIRARDGYVYQRSPAPKIK